MWYFRAYQPMKVGKDNVISLVRLDYTLYLKLGHHAVHSSKTASSHKYVKKIVWIWTVVPVQCTPSTGDNYERMS